MISIGTTFDFKNNGILKAESISFNSEGDVIINGTSEVRRIKLTDRDIEKVKLPFTKDYKTGFKLKNSKNHLDQGVYKIEYNNTFYSMTYLDELETFEKLVLKVKN